MGLIVITECGNIERKTERIQLQNVFKAWNSATRTAPLLPLTQDLWKWSLKQAQYVLWYYELKFAALVERGYLT